MGRLLEFNEKAAFPDMTDKYLIRVPLRMTQITEKDGCVWPVAFEWRGDEDLTVNIKIDRVISVVPCAELKSGAVGDRFECDIECRREYLFYSKLQPRKWFVIKEVSKEEYEAYYRLPGDA